MTARPRKSNPKRSPISIRLGPDLQDRIEERIGTYDRTYVIERDLSRYYDMLRRELASAGLSIDEACYLCDLLNGTLLEPTSVRFLWAEVLDGDLLNGLGQKWNVDAQALAAKLKECSQAQCLAITDAAERFWSGPYREDSTREAVAKVFGIRLSEEVREETAEKEGRTETTEMPQTE